MTKDFVAGLQNPDRAHLMLIAEYAAFFVANFLVANFLEVMSLLLKTSCRTKKVAGSLG
jgi:hypothetical protein